MRYLRWAIRAFLFVWELPQNLLGIGALAYDRAIGFVVQIKFERERLMIETRRRAISLGLFVFWTRQSNHWIELDERTKNHEWGHSVQSRMLGPLYLLVVGIPSTLRVIYLMAYRKIKGRRWNGYFDGFPENWADRLGGVQRVGSRNK
jgi:hypothetical protein